MAQPSLEENTPQPQVRRPTIFQRFWRWLRPTSQTYHYRLVMLERSIDSDPQSPVGYVLRGEVYLAMNEPHKAMLDFKAALERSERQLQTREWGVVAQAMQDRAQAGLKRAQRQATAPQPTPDIGKDEG